MRIKEILLKKINEKYINIEKLLNIIQQNNIEKNFICEYENDEIIFCFADENIATKIPNGNINNSRNYLDEYKPDFDHLIFNYKTSGKIIIDIYLNNLHISSFYKNDKFINNFFNSIKRKKKIENIFKNL